MLTLTLKIIRLVDGLAFGKNKSGMLVFKKNDSNDKIVIFSVCKDDIKFAKKLKKII